MITFEKKITAIAGGLHRSYQQLRARRLRSSGHVNHANENSLAKIGLIIEVGRETIKRSTETTISWYAGRWWFGSLLTLFRDWTYYWKSTGLGQSEIQTILASLLFTLLWSVRYAHSLYTKTTKIRTRGDEVERLLLNHHHHHTHQPPKWKIFANCYCLGRNRYEYL